MPDLMINNRAYKVAGILFDKDGTLLDFIAMWGCWSESVFSELEQQLKRRGITLQPDRIATLWGTKHDINNRVIDYDRNGPLAMGTMQDLYAVVAWQLYSEGLSWAEAMELVQHCKKHADIELERLRPARPLPGSIDFLKSCKEHGIKLGVVTADETEAANMHLEWLGIRAYFDVVIGNDLVERGKPFPDMLELACRELAIDCSEAAIIGDTNGDMRMGLAAGAAVTVGIADTAEGGSTHQLLPNANEVISSYSQLSMRRQAHED
ncbi:HAD family hydrolase [Paenibacillus sp. PL91]|uniref:HAD family hydrolase n=1 Tax=Paenibacillus sp. PL91 TaxID=2729538 RepID=UPI00145CCEA7|nr:HAD family hydrolase [Paenibacillus sp. PL91]MBC9200235.1 HAD family hydrolase [Paenibacillus sp. PL91]